MRKVKFPLKLKLLIVMIVLIASSLTVFVGIALKTFHEDKSAYIYEMMLNKASSEQIILAQKLGKESFAMVDSKLKRGGIEVTEDLNKFLGQEDLYNIKIVIPKQRTFYQWKNGKVFPVQEDEKDILQPITDKSIRQAVKEASLNGEKVLYAYDYNPSLNYAYVVTLPHEKAFAVTTYLVKKSIFYGLFILGVAMILSVLLARPLTAQLEKLFGMTQEIAKGNFSQRIRLRGHDEVVALSDSVNDMADKIVIYMDEMKEKARLENEVHVAQLVQSSFFPTGKIPDQGLSLDGHFEPATECGGDWWGFSDHGDWRIFFIADATGHGVPAALLTATVNCCKTSIAFIAETRPNIISEPNEILRYMNQAVCGAGKEIQVTCFVASFNKKTRNLIYSNSSQTPPLLWNGQKADLVKEDFRVLIEANGPRLGQAPETRYVSHTLGLEPHDTILFYTDGLTEALDLEGKAYGQRRLIKTLLQNGSNSTSLIVERVIEDLKSFTTQKPINDDLTVVAMKVNV